MSLTIRPESECRYDIVSLGEVMLRLDPGEGRIRTTRNFQVWEGGGEYNVARGLRRAFGLRAGVVTALADNAVGQLVEDFILTGGVDTSLIHWAPFDGLGREVRNGLNFTERGFGPITTEVALLADTPAGEFYLAEDEHQQYLAKNPDGYCNHGPNGVSCQTGVLG